MEEILVEEWKGFKGDDWKEEIDVSSFIDKNYTEYTGDDTFLVGPTAKTNAVWKRCEELLDQEMKNGGCLDVETNILSGITAYAPGYIDKDNEVIVGLQTDAPLKRAIMPNGGIRIVEKSCEACGKEVDPELDKIYHSIQLRPSSSLHLRQVAP